MHEEVNRMYSAICSHMIRQGKKITGIAYGFKICPEYISAQQMTEAVITAEKCVLYDFILQLYDFHYTDSIPVSFPQAYSAYYLINTTGLWN